MSESEGRTVPTIEEVSMEEAAELFENGCRKWFNMSGAEFNAACARGEIDRDTAKAHIISDLAWLLRGGPDA